MQVCRLSHKDSTRRTTKALTHQCVYIQRIHSTVVFDSYEKLHDAPIKNNRLEDKSLDKNTNNGNTNLEKEDNSKNV